MNVIFLDIDGVLNSDRYDRSRREDQGNIDETRLPLLKRIIEETGAVIVLSSSWRKHWEKDPEARDAIGKELDGLFGSNGLAIADKTPVLPDRDRAGEIRLWLARNGNPEGFVILDDIAFGWGEDLFGHLVKTNSRIGRGLEEEHVNKAIAILQKKEDEV